MSAVDTCPTTTLGLGSPDLLENILEELEALSTVLGQVKDVIDGGTLYALESMIEARAKFARELYVERRDALETA